MKKPKTTKPGLPTLDEWERVVCAYARKASGPGWANDPLYVVIEDHRTGKMREECIQPGQQNYEMRLLYNIAAQVDLALMFAVANLLRGKKP
jgi:hypothetical protein